MWVKGEIFRDLDAVTVSARGELDRAAQASLFDRLDWFRRTAEHAPSSGRPLIVRARTEGSDCWLFLSEQNGRAHALASWYTLLFRPVFTGDPSEAAKFALLIASARRLAKRTAILTLAPIGEADAALICRAFDRARWIATSRATTVNWSVATADLSFADYWAQRPGELRSTIQRKASKHCVETKIFRDFDEDAWTSYEAIYAASWKSDEGAPAFLRDMAMVEGSAGTLRLGLATIDGRAVAAQLWTVENGRATIHKLAHIEDAAAQSPGSILTAAMFEHVIDEDRVALVDFGTGNDAYKADWMDFSTPLYTVQLFNPRKPAGLWGAAKGRLSALVRRRGIR